MYICNPGHRVSRPRGTGSVDDSVGEGRARRKADSWLGHTAHLATVVHVPTSGWRECAYLRRTVGNEAGTSLANLR